MGLHKPFDRHLIVLNNAVMTSGGSTQLAKGQIGLFDTTQTTVNGLVAVNSLAGQSRDKLYQIKSGTSDRPLTRSHSNKADSTFPFSMNDVLRVSVSAPTTTEQKVDEVIVGYNGIQAATAISFTKGQRKELTIRLSGEPIGILGYADNFVDISYTMIDEPCNPLDDGCEECDDCETVSCTPIVLRAIEFLKDYQLRGNVPASEFVEITPIKSCGTEPEYSTTDYSVWTLTVPDIGDSIALALVQAQFPSYKVERIERNGVNSVYQILALSSATLDPYVQSIASLIKGCDTCPTDYTATTGGYFYAVTIEDDGADLTTTVDDLSGFVTGTVVKSGQNNGVGYYTLVLSTPLSAANLNTFLTASATKATATVTLIGSILAICENGDTTEIDWEEGETCTASTQEYNIILPDDECGSSRLTEIRASYPDLTINIDTQLTGESSRTLTLTGTSGTANVTITGTGTAYLATFTTNLTTSAANFVTSHGATILADEGLTVTSSGAIITFVGATTDFPTIARANVSGDLSGTLGEVTALTENIVGGCQTQYTTTVITNIVCDECDAIYTDVYTTTPPADFDGRKWTLVSPTPDYSTDCLCGIRFKGKVLEVQPDDCLRDEFGFIDSSVKIEVSGGYTTETREAIGDTTDHAFNVEYLSKWQPRTHLGGNMWQEEDMSRKYFTGEQRHSDHTARFLLGEESLLEAGKQYVDYAIEIQRENYSQGMTGKDYQRAVFHIFAEVGLHTNVETMVNKIAAAAGKKGVQAFGNV